MQREYVWFDGRLVYSEEASVSVKVHSLHYGTSVFEGIRAYSNGRKLCVFRLQDHMKRLIRSANMLYLKTSYTAEELCEATVDLLRKNGFSNPVYIRPIIFVGSGGINLDYRKHPVHTSIFAFPFASYFERQGLRVCVSSWRRVSNTSMLPRAKASANYLNSCIATIEAKISGYDEAILLDQNGYVSEGAGENIFMVSDGKLVTPEVYSSILEGITRDTVIKIALDKGIEVNCRPIDRSELYTADEMFFTGTAAEVEPVIEVDGRRVGDGKPGKITEEIKRSYTDVVTGRAQKYRHWLTEV
ncbi:MAG: branched-chain amino acid transaminase [Conexivisphaerales archaeon]